MSFGDIEMKTADVISFSRAVTRMADQNFPMETSLFVTFVMEDRSFERVFSYIPNYGELWKTLCDTLDLDAAAAMSFRIYMDDVLLNNLNTIDMLAEAIESGSAARSIILKVSQSPYYPNRSPAGGYKRSLRARICPHVFYMLVVLLVATVLGARIRNQDDAIKSGLAQISDLSSSLDRQIKAAKGCAAVGGGAGQTACLAKVSTLTDTLKDRDDRLEEQRSTLQDREHRIQMQESTLQDRENRIERQKVQIQQGEANISRLKSSLAEAKQRTREISRCTTLVHGTRTWTCNSDCSCVHL